MIRNVWYIVVLASVLAFSACEKGSTEDEQTSGEAATGVVEVASDGTQFDPPVQIEQIPPGAWYCDMGTVHYASLEQGEGTCPICGMSLAQVPHADPEPAPAAAAPAPTEVTPPAAAPVPTEIAPPSATPAPTTAPAGQ